MVVRSRTKNLRSLLAYFLNMILNHYTSRRLRISDKIIAFFRLGDLFKRFEIRFKRCDWGGTIRLSFALDTPSLGVGRGLFLSGGGRGRFFLKVDGGGVEGGGVERKTFFLRPNKK